VGSGAGGVNRQFVYIGIAVGEVWCIYDEFYSIVLSLNASGNANIQFDLSTSYLYQIMTSNNDFIGHNGWPFCVVKHCKWCIKIYVT